MSLRKLGFYAVVAGSLYFLYKAMTFKKSAIPDSKRPAETVLTPNEKTVHGPVPISVPAHYLGPSYRQQTPSTVITSLDSSKSYFPVGDKNSTDVVSDFKILNVLGRYQYG